MSFIISKDKSRVQTSKRATNLSYRTSGTEPTLHEIFSDPIIHLIAQSDKIHIDDLKLHVEQARLKITKSTPILKAAIQ